MQPTDPPPPESLANLPQEVPPRPRAVRRRPGRGWLLGQVPILVWLLILAGLVPLVLALRQVIPALIVTVFGTTVPGKVLGTSAAEFPNPPAYHVTFSYHVRDQEYKAETLVTESTFAQLYMGVDVKVRVLPAWPGRPQLLVPGGEVGGGEGICLLGFAVLWLGGLGVVAGAYLRKPLRQKRLVRDGVATTGWIVRKEEAPGRRRGWHLRYAYRAPAHGLGPGTTSLRNGAPAGLLKEWQVIMVVRTADAEAVQVGTQVTVLYDLHRPSHSLIYPFGDYEAVSAPAA